MDETGHMADRLTAAFSHIAETRMRGLPLLNHALRVECVGPVHWQGEWLAVMVTPWFMNLMLLPETRAAWSHTPGATISRSLPSGTYSFVAAEDEVLGPTLSCSLFSPMFDFSSQEDAVALAREVLSAAMAPAGGAAAELSAGAPENPSRRALFGLGRKPAAEAV